MKTIDELVREVASNLNVGKADIKPAIKPAHKTAVPTKEIEKPSVNTDENKRLDKMTLGIAKDIAKAVELAAKITGVNVVVSVRDEGANLILLHAMDNSYIASIQASQDKAYTSVALKMPTHIALEESRGGALDGLTNGNGILLLGGGYPLNIADKIYGGVGVSGGSKEQDIMLAMVATEYFKARFA